MKKKDNTNGAVKFLMTRDAYNKAEAEGIVRLLRGLIIERMDAGEMYVGDILGYYNLTTDNLEDIIAFE